MAAQLGMLWVFLQRVLYLNVNSRSRTALMRLKTAWENRRHLAVTSEACLDTSVSCLGNKHYRWCGVMQCQHYWRAYCPDIRHFSDQVGILSWHMGRHGNL